MPTIEKVQYFTRLYYALKHTLPSITVGGLVVEGHQQSLTPDEYYVVINIVVPYDETVYTLAKATFIEDCVVTHSADDILIEISEDNDYSFNVTQFVKFTQDG